MPMPSACKASAPFLKKKKKPAAWKGNNPVEMISILPQYTFKRLKGLSGKVDILVWEVGSDDL